MFCTFLLTGLGFFCRYLFSWLPLRMVGVAWFPSFLLLGLLGYWHYPQFGDAGTPPHWFTLVLLCFFYALLLMLSRAMSDSVKERDSFPTYAWPNLIQLIAFSVISVSLCNTDVVLHHTLRSVRALSEKDYDRMLAEAQWERHPSHTLSALTALALSETGQLGERLFDYPQPYGSDGLLPSADDTLLFYNPHRALGLHLGYHKSPRTSTMLFLQVINAMPKVRPAACDYLLCGLLLDRNLDAFASLLPVGDSLSPDLPRHYREAQMLYRHLHPVNAQPVADGETIPAEDPLSADFADFLALLKTEGTREEREFRCRERFAHTYWCYYYFNENSPTTTACSSTALPRTRTARSTTW